MPPRISIIVIEGTNARLGGGKEREGGVYCNGDKVHFVV